MKPGDRISTEVLVEHKWHRYKHDEYVLEDGKTGEYYYIDQKGSVCIVPVLPDGRIVMERQFRYLFQKDSIELPAGGVRDHEDLDQKAKDELEEEVGYRAGAMRQVAEYAPFNALFTEIVHLYIATNLAATAQRLEETERIEPLAFTPAEIDDMIRSGEIWDGYSIAAWQVARLHLGL